MRYDLAAHLRGRGIRRKDIALRPIEPTAALATGLSGPARAIIKAGEAVIRERLLPVYEPRPTLTRDDSASAMSDALAAVGAAMQRLVVGLVPQVGRWAVRVEEWHRPRFAAAVKAATSTDVSSLLGQRDGEDELQAALQWGASLIQGLTEDLRGQVETAVWAAYSSGTPRAALAKTLAERLAVARARADFIARDQTTKLAANLDGMRQRQAGIDRYRWRHSGKTHPRPEHVAREGKIFLWSQPPAGGHPGTEPNCGCRAQAYVALD